MLEGQWFELTTCLETYLGSMYKTTVYLALPQMHLLSKKHSISVRGTCPLLETGCNLVSR